MYVWMISPSPLDRETLQLAMFTGTQIRLGMSWLGGCLSRLPNTGARKAQHSHLMADTGIIEPQRVIPTRL